MKKFIALLLAMVMLLSFVACGNSNTPEATEAKTENAAADNTVADTKGEAPKETITLQMWGGVQGEYGYDQMVENFNKEFADKGIQIEYNKL